MACISCTNQSSKSRRRIPDENGKDRMKLTIQPVITSENDTGYLHACRCCLTTEGALETIDLPMAKAFSTIIGREVVRNDGFPCCLCFECKAYLIKAVEFRRKTRRALAAFEKLLQRKDYQVTLNDVSSINRKKAELLSSLGIVKESTSYPEFHITNAVNTSQSRHEDDYDILFQRGDITVRKVRKAQNSKASDSECIEISDDSLEDHTDETDSPVRHAENKALTKVAGTEKGSGSDVTIVIDSDLTDCETDSEDDNLKTKSMLENFKTIGPGSVRNTTTDGKTQEVIKNGYDPVNFSSPAEQDRQSVGTRDKVSINQLSPGNTDNDTTNILALIEKQLKSANSVTPNGPKKLKSPDKQKESENLRYTKNKKNNHLRNLIDKHIESMKSENQAQNESNSYLKTSEIENHSKNRKIPIEKQDETVNFESLIDRQVKSVSSESLTNRGNESIDPGIPNELQNESHDSRTQKPNLPIITLKKNKISKPFVILNKSSDVLLQECPVDSVPNAQPTKLKPTDTQDEKENQTYDDLVGDTILDDKILIENNISTLFSDISINTGNTEDQQLSENSFLRSYLTSPCMTSTILDGLPINNNSIDLLDNVGDNFNTGNPLLVNMSDNMSYIDDIGPEKIMDHITDIEGEVIDLNDVFKGLKEPSDSELESLEEEENDDVWNEEKRKIEAEYNLMSRKLEAQILAKAGIRYIPFSEQLDILERRRNTIDFQLSRYNCVGCALIFRSLQGFISHTELHNDSKRYSFSCKVCHCNFDSQASLDRHAMAEHWYEYSCPRCKQKHYNLDDLVKCKYFNRFANSYTADTSRCGLSIKRQRNMKRTLLTPQEVYQLTRIPGPYRCLNCDAEYTTETALKKHSGLHQSNVKGVYCDICKARSYNVRILGDHIATFHQYKYTCKLCKLSVYNLRASKIHQRKCRMKPAGKYCNFCNSYVREKLEWHIQDKHGMHCNICGITEAGKENLYIHQMQQHGYLRLNTVEELNDPRFHCHLCQTYFCDEKAYFKHLCHRHATEAKIYKNGCVTCQNIFTDKTKLEEHDCQPVVGVDKYLKYIDCTHCGERFKNVEGHLNHYLNVHPLLPYSIGQREGDYLLCEYCGKTYRKTCMPYHLKMHANEENRCKVKCRFCKQKCTPSQQAVHVLNTHTYKPFMCVLCEERFDKRDHCRDHILKIHAPALPYRCELCPRSLAHVDLLNEHNANFHGITKKLTYRHNDEIVDKIYVYPDMKIDGSLIPSEYLIKTDVYMCDYLEENVKRIEPNECFFFDSTVTIPPRRRKEQFGPDEMKRLYHKQRNVIRKQELLRKNMNKCIRDNDANGLVALLRRNDINGFKQDQIEPPRKRERTGKLNILEDRKLNRVDDLLEPEPKAKKPRIDKKADILEAPTFEAENPDTEVDLSLDIHTNGIDNDMNTGDNKNDNTETVFIDDDTFYETEGYVMDDSVSDPYATEDTGKDTPETMSVDPKETISDVFVDANSQNVPNNDVSDVLTLNQKGDSEPSDVMGELVAHEGKLYVLIEGILYAFEENAS